MIPAAMNIEAAIDSLKTMDKAILEDQGKELHFAMGSYLTSQFESGYELGLQTARVIVAGSVVLAKAGIDPKDIL